MPTNRANDVIRVRREELGLTDVEVAQRSGLSIYEYGDVEDDETELYMVLPLKKIKSLCQTLGIDMLSLYRIGKCDREITPRLLLNRRQEKGITIRELSDQVGISEEMLVKAEYDPSSIGEWVMDSVLALAQALDVSPACLLEQVNPKG